MTRNRGFVKGVICIVAIVVAGVIIAKYGFRPNPGASPKKMTFICSNCGDEFEINTADSNKLLAENPKKTGGIKCPSCGQFKARRAIFCMHCGKYYLEQQSIEQFGERGRCPHCKKSARNPPDGESGTE